MKEEKPAYNDYRLQYAILNHGRKCRKSLISCMRRKGNCTAYCTVCNSALYTWDPTKAKRHCKLEFQELIMD